MADETIEDFVSISPNPANPVATITYSIKNPSDVKLTIYSINGQKVATLINGPLSAGRHSVTFNGAKYASGVYFYHFESAGLTTTGKMLLLKQTSPSPETERALDEAPFLFPIRRQTAIST